MYVWYLKLGCGQEGKLLNSEAKSCFYTSESRDPKIFFPGSGKSDTFANLHPCLCFKRNFE